MNRRNSKQKQENYNSRFKLSEIEEREKRKTIL